MTKTQNACRLTALVLFAVSVAACGGGAPSADKAGGSTAQTVLRLAYVDWTTNGEDAQLVHRFADEVRSRSHGHLVIRVIDTAYGTPDEESRVARVVQENRFDLGWITTGAWEDVGVGTFAALEAPFLVDSYRLMDKLARSGLARRMLHGLSMHGLVGLALVPDALLHPAGQHPFTRPADFRGVDFLVLRSRTMNAVLRVLGAKPVFSVQAVASPWGALEPTWHGAYVLTGNVVLYPRIDTLFASAHRFGRLSEDQRRVLRMAARNLIARSVERRPSAAVAAELQCQNGEIALADPNDLRLLARATRPITARLEQDSETSARIAEIRRLKAATTADPPVSIPADCRRTHSSSSTATAYAGVLNGTYRYTLTRAAALRYLPTRDPGADFPAVITVRLRNGRWTLRTDETASGTYTIAGHLATFRRPGFATLRFNFTRDAAGGLTLRPKLPMDRGDQFVWSSSPWRRIGPPA